MSVHIDENTKVTCARHGRHEFEASYNLGSNEITVRGMCPDCLKEARDADTQHMQKQLDDYHKSHLSMFDGNKPNIEWNYPYKMLRVCFGDHSAHDVCKFVEFQKIEIQKS